MRIDSRHSAPQTAADSALQTARSLTTEELTAAAPPAGRPAELARLDAARTLTFLLLLLFLNLQADGLPLAPGPAYQLHLLPFTLLFLAGLLALLFPARTAALLPAALVRPLNSWRTLVAVETLFVVLSAGLLFAEARVFARFGYQPHPAALAGIALLGVAALRTSLRASATRLVAVTLALLATFSLFSIFSFPLTVRRSDMLPLLSAANRSLLAHATPYRLYHFPSESVLLTYLPGTLLAYLPATLLHLDLRLTNLLALLLLAAVLLASVRPERRHMATALIALFLLGPYLLFRHDLYTPPHWLALATALLLAQRGSSPRTAAVLFGVGVAASQFSWILLPFFLLFLYEVHGLRIVLQSTALTLLSAALLTVPFALADPHAFLFGVLAHWQSTGLTARPVNLSFYTAALLGQQRLQLVQLAVLALLFFAAVRTHACRTFPGTMRAMSLALAAFVLLNLLVWGYFFLLLQLLLLLYLLGANDLLSNPVPSISASHRKT